MKKHLALGMAALFGLGSFLGCTAAKKPSAALTPTPCATSESLEDMCRKDVKEKIDKLTALYQKNYPGYEIDASAYEKELYESCPKLNEDLYFKINFNGSITELENAVKAKYEKEYGKNYDKELESAAEFYVHQHYRHKCYSGREFEVIIPSQGALAVSRTLVSNPIILIADEKVMFLTKKDDLNSHISRTEELKILEDK